jgi:hypothetical protein
MRMGSAQRQLPLSLTFRAATVAIAVAVVSSLPPLSPQACGQEGCTSELYGFKTPCAESHTAAARNFSML